MNFPTVTARKVPGVLLAVKRDGRFARDWNKDLAGQDDKGNLPTRLVYLRPYVDLSL
jgi:hypothetical protein